MFGVIGWMRCHLQCKGCQTYAECGVINTECCDVILSGYYVIYIVDMMSQIYWMGYHTYSGSDVTCIVYMLPYILDVVSYIEVVMSKVQ